jgi:flagellar motility protein MotE (MotC chaperone)/sporulation protein YlmC with PRC-barrel domain
VATIALTDLLGAPVYGPIGGRCGRVREVAIVPQEDRSRIAALIVKTGRDLRMVQANSVITANPLGLHTNEPQAHWATVPQEGLLLLERDLLDQQIIDVHGRKVVRVNDADISVERQNSHIVLRITSVDVGARGALRRLFKGVVPQGALQALLNRIPERAIPWDFVDLIETDPARRVKLKISHQRLAKLHPADIADIIEELSPAEREAVFESLDDNVAAEALEEIDPKLQVSIVSALDSEKAADILEEMDPDAAADLLGDLPPSTSEEILEEMEPEEREEVAELLGFEQNTAAGHMTTEYLALSPRATGADAVELLRKYEGAHESINSIFLVDDEWHLVGAVPVTKLVLAAPTTPVSELTTEPLISSRADMNEKEVAELFDKYNLLTLPVIDEQGKLTGVITADDVISLLRSRL